MPLVCRAPQPMKFPLIFALLTLGALGQDGRFAINEKKAPETRVDLEALQRAVGDALPKARAATVCIELPDGSGSGVIVSPDGLVLTAHGEPARPALWALVVDLRVGDPSLRSR